MVKLSLEQQAEELRDLVYHLKGFDDLQVVELQAQQIKRLIYFAQKGLTAFKSQKQLSKMEMTIDGSG